MWREIIRLRKKILQLHLKVNEEDSLFSPVLLSLGISPFLRVTR